ncbi:flavin reductase [Marinomonas sp. 42_23_T18]|nr:flavin reductase [Marinomonas sp. 42_23_T18]
MIFKLENMSSNQRYHLITQTVLPRPIAWILTANQEETFNLAPFSYFAALSSEPALLVVSIGNKNKNLNKDTKTNLLREKECILHIPSRELADEVNTSAATLAYGDSEVSQQGLSLTPFTSTLPRLSNAKVAMHCRLYDVHQLGDSQSACYLEVLSIHVEDKLVSEDSGRYIIDSLALSPLSRLGGNQYGVLTETLSLKRPS